MQESRLHDFASLQGGGRTHCSHRCCSSKAPCMYDAMDLLSWQLYQSTQLYCLFILFYFICCCLFLFCFWLCFIPSSPFTLTSNSPPLCLCTSPWPWRNDRPLNYLHRLIAADCNCRELFRLRLKIAHWKGGRQKRNDIVTQINYTLPKWSISLFQKQQLWKPNCVDQWHCTGQQHRAALHRGNRVTSWNLLGYVKERLRRWQVEQQSSWLTWAELTVVTAELSWTACFPPSVLLL